MKISERIHWADNDRKMVVQKTHAIDPYLQENAFLREQGLTGSDDKWLVARIPTFLFGEWLKEAGLRWDSPRGDIDAMLQRKINDPDFKALRIKEGRVTL
jgi:hypothetical protein